ncbi:hypothetical protein GCM10027443_22910 [Pontibacter brevis]
MIKNYTKIKVKADPFIRNIDAPGLKIEKFFSHVYYEEPPKLISKHQYAACSPKEFYELSSPNSEGLAWLRSELWMFYHERFFLEVRPSVTDAFLDFHLYQSKNKADFLDFVKNSPDYFCLRYIFRKIDPTELRLAKKRANDWVAKRVKLLGSAPEKRKPNTRGRIRAMRDGVEVSIWEVERFFMDRWARPKKLGEKGYILTEEQVKVFVHTYFHGSPYSIKMKKMKSAGTQKDILMAVDEFFCTRDTDTSGTHDYCYMLIDAFQEFKNYINPTTGEYMVTELGKNFARYRNPKWMKKRVKI